MRHTLSYKLALASCAAGTSTNGWRLVNASTGTVVSTTAVTFSGSTTNVTGSFTVPSTGSYYIEIFRNTNNTGTCQFRVDEVSITYSGTVVDTNCTTPDGYMFAFNGQLKDDEVYGEGNSYTAEFWQYDPRIARRWNLDPKPQVLISDYACFSNNPIYNVDVKGDKSDGWIEDKETGKMTWDDNVNSTDDFAKSGYDKNKFAYQGQQNYGSVDPAGGAPITYNDGLGNSHPTSSSLSTVKVTPLTSLKGQYPNTWHLYQDAGNYGPLTASDIWYTDPVRSVIADYYTVGVNVQSSSGIYLNEELNLTFMLRGKDPGIYFNSSTGFGEATSIGIDIGGSVGHGWTLGNPHNLSSKMLGGWQVSRGISTGFEFGIGGSAGQGVDIGLDDNNIPATATHKFGVTGGVGVSTPFVQGSTGMGKSTTAITLIKF